MTERAEEQPRSERVQLGQRPPKDPDALSDDVWGYRDSGFEIDDEGAVHFRGDRYPISGSTLPDLLPWASGILGVELDPFDQNDSAYPPALPERRTNEGFETAVETLLDEDQLGRDALVRLRHGHGHTQEEMWAIKHGHVERVPDLVVWPERDEEVRRLVELAALHDVCLIPYGGGTNVTDALRCPSEEQRSIVSVDMSRMNGLRWIDAENRMACIEAGATGAEIADQLAAHGFTLGHEPDSYELSTLGGWIATHASGMKKNRYGNIEDLVLEISAVTPSGELHRENVPPRESTGGDPARWLIGSEGRLGIVTACVMKIFPLPEAREHGSVLFESFEQGFRFMHAVQSSGVVPASIRLMDNLQFQFGQALKPARSGVAALKSRLEKVFVTRVKGFDVDRMVACTLLFEGSRAEVRAQQQSVYAIAARHGGMKAGAENGARGYQLTFAIAYIRDFMMPNHIIAESFETAVPWSQTLSLCDNVKQRIFEEHEKRGLPGRPFISCRITQLYDTGVCVYFYYAFYYKGIDRPSELYSELEAIAREEILRSGGSLSHHHGVGKLRKHFLPRIYSEAALRWREALKRSVDPGNVFGCDN